MTFEDTDLMAYMDGELSPSRRREIEKQLAQSPELRQQLEHLQAADTLLTDSLAHTSKRTARPDTMALVNDLANKLGNHTAQPVNNLVALETRAQNTRSIWTRPFMPQAIAASVALLVGFSLGNLTTQTESGAGMNTEYAMGIVSPHSPLYQALETSASQEAVRFGVENEASATPLTTFRAEDGIFCREFSTSAPEGGSHGIACRKNRGWRIKAVVATDPARTSDTDMFVTASDTTTDPISNMIMTMMEGDALSVSDEEKAITGDWN